MLDSLVAVHIENLEEEVGNLKLSDRVQGLIWIFIEVVLLVILSVLARLSTNPILTGTVVDAAGFFYIAIGIMLKKLKLKVGKRQILIGFLTYSLTMTFAYGVNKLGIGQQYPLFFGTSLIVTGSLAIKLIGLACIVKATVSGKVSKEMVVPIISAAISVFRQKMIRKTTEEEDAGTLAVIAIIALLSSPVAFLAGPKLEPINIVFLTVFGMIYYAIGFKTLWATRVTTLREQNEVGATEFPLANFASALFLRGNIDIFVVVAMSLGLIVKAIQTKNLNKES
jgi:hypothetical protein